MTKLLVILVSLSLLASSCVNQKQPEPPMDQYYNKQITVGDKELYVQIVTNEQDMSKGLSGRPPLKENQGMLFDYGKTNFAKHGFWMKGMNFSLDLIWIKDGSIIGISKNIPKPVSGTLEKDLITYYPPSEVNMVLEVLSGWAERNNIKTGDEIKLQ
jgi:uncharacterized membrane protein (UPF0127 family)